MINKFLPFLVFSPLFLVLPGCSEILESPQEISTNIQEDYSDYEYSFSEDETVLGDVISIPYSIENLRKAFDSLPQETKAGYTEEDIQPTHYYVRFAPKNEEELDILINTPGLLLSEVPLDREIARGGVCYHDPSLPITQPTYQYSTLEIPYWKSLMDSISVEGEVLIEAYMPEEVSDTKSLGSFILPDSFYEPLLKEAYVVSGNEYDVLPETKGSWWTPNGRIRVWDNIVNGYTPIQDVVVRGTHFLKVRETTTDANGYFSLPSFKNPVQLKVIWEGRCWDVRDGNLGQAVYDGPRLSYGSWYLNINFNDVRSRNIATVFRAARRVYNGYNNGLYKPANSRREKIAYIHNGISSGANGDYNQQYGAGIWSDIRIAGKNEYGWRLPSEIFSTTCHELGHAAHYTNAKWNYKNSELRVLESWARFYQYLCTINEYTALGVASNLWEYDDRGIMKPDVKYNFQNIYASSGIQTYTPLFIDIYDTYNQHDFDSPYPNDVISGFPPASLQVVVYGATTFEEIKQHFLKLVNTTGYRFGITTESVNDLFSFYE